MTRGRITGFRLLPGCHANYADIIRFGNNQIEKTKIVLRVAIHGLGKTLHTCG